MNRYKYGKDIEQALQIAIEAHKGQNDLEGKPYILHVLRVMHSVNTDKQKITAILHDVVEDTDWTFDKLKQEGFSDEIVKAIDSVTKRKGEEYLTFVNRSNKNVIGRIVKIADITDNIDIKRIKKPTKKTFEMMKRYRKALRILKVKCN